MCRLVNINKEKKRGASIFFDVKRQTEARRGGKTQKSSKKFKENAIKMAE